MALQKDTPIGNTGLVCNYIKVEGFTYSSEDSVLQVAMGIFLSKDASHEGKEPLSRSNLNVDYNALSGTGDIITQVYNLLKTLPAFDGAIDV